MLLTKFSNNNKTIDKSIDRLLFIIAVIAIFLMNPFFVWSDTLIIYRTVHLVGNIIFLYLIIKHHKTNFYNISLVFVFLIISIYMMIGGTTSSHFSYLFLITLFFISLQQSEHFRVFEHFVNILTVVYFIGIISYLLSLSGLNVPFGTVIFKGNPNKFPYLVYFGHVQETYLPNYRFSSIFDEPGVVGTVNGLILASIGISLRNVRSLILLLAGLISFSLAFYIILICILLYKFNLKNILIIAFFASLIILYSGELFNKLIISRMKIEDKKDCR